MDQNYLEVKAYKGIWRKMLNAFFPFSEILLILDNKIRKVMLTDLRDFLFPNYCIACHIILHNSQHYFCVKCFYNLPKTNWFLDQNNEMYDKLSKLMSLESATALFRLNAISKKILHELKYKKKEGLGEIFSEMLLPYLESHLSFDAVITIPIHPKKLKIRGYNQNRFLGESLAKKMSIPFYLEGLTRKKHQESQTFSSRKERLVRLEDTFELGDFDMRHKHILLIDDVCTTGSTLYHCAKILQEKSAAKVSVVTIAMA